MNVLITGANQGIGYYMVKQLLESGSNVTVLDLEISKLLKLKEDFTTNLLPIECDVCNGEAMEAAVKESVEQFGGIDIAVHNACRCTFEPMEETKMDTYQKVMDVNFYGALRLAKNVVPHMMQVGKGRMIFTSSGVGVTGFYNISPYASSKGALESLAKCLLQEYKGSGISFHLMHPPLTQTNSSSPLPVPKEMMTIPEKVGIGLAKRINKNSFVICHSSIQQFQIKLSYLFPLKFGSMMTIMTKRSQQTKD